MFICVTFELQQKKTACCFYPTGRVYYFLVFYFLMQIFRLPVVFNRPPPHIDFFTVNLLHNQIILPHLIFFVNANFRIFGSVLLFC
jgi:hypothetical protein